MRMAKVIAVVNQKGGVGKTTFASTLCRLYAAEGRTVLAADVDPDANLGLALGFSEEEVNAIVPISKMRKLVEGLGKQPVVVADINGFIINRIQFAVLREALHIVDIGAATIEDVDTVLKAGMGLRYAALGPFGVADFGGLDTFDHINSYLNAELDDSKVGNKRLHEMVEAGKLGVKSGQGFYDYSGDKADEAIRERDRLYIELAKVLYFKK